MFGVLRIGRLGDFLPLSAVHGRLSAVGDIIIAKQAFVLLGADACPPELMAALPARIGTFHPAVARIARVRRAPGPMVVPLVAVPLGIALDLDHKHTYLFFGDR